MTLKPFAVIGLPQHLFYGTGIPACVLVINKDKPRELRGKILFINADGEYGESRNQNFLRPEDIEKISYVFDHKLEIPKYSRLVTVEEIESNDFNLNIRRYVDNSPDSEIEDVKAHLAGGMPKREVACYGERLRKFGMEASVLLQERDSDYFLFKPEVSEKQRIREIIEFHEAIGRIEEQMEKELAGWWEEASAEISGFPQHNHTARFRREFLTKFKTRFAHVGVLDEFQLAGIFVNWWETIKYDLKTIVAVGWSNSLVPDEYIQGACFAKDAEEMGALESEITELESGLSEVLETVEMESEDDEESEEQEKNAGNVKKYLQSRIKDLQSRQASDKGRQEIKAMKKTLKEIEAKELAIKKARKSLKERQKELEQGIEAKKQNLSPEEAHRLILQKLFDILQKEMRRYLGSEKKKLIGIFEKLWDKYQVSLAEIEAERGLRGGQAQ